VSLDRRNWSGLAALGLDIAARLIPRSLALALTLSTLAAISFALRARSSTGGRRSRP
jgi:hypothetical protein